MPFCSASLFDSGAVWLARALPLPCRALTRRTMWTCHCALGLLLDSAANSRAIYWYRIPPANRRSGGPAARRRLQRPAASRGPASDRLTRPGTPCLPGRAKSYNSIARLAGEDQPPARSPPPGQRAPPPAAAAALRPPAAPGRVGGPARSPPPGQRAPPTGGSGGAATVGPGRRAARSPPPGPARPPTGGGGGGAEWGAVGFCASRQI